MIRRSFLLCLLALLLINCSQTPSVDYPPPSLSTAPPPAQWSIKAKLGIRTAEDSGSVTLDWQQTDSDFSIKIQGPLGQGNATISGNEAYVLIEQPGKPPLQSTDAATLIKETFGWSLPIDNFKFWVRGIANPESPIHSVNYGPTGTLSTLEQSQWVLDYSRYKIIERWQLPGRIRAKQAETQLTLIIREWQLL